MQTPNTYEQFVKPRLAQVLHALGLDVAFHRAVGDHIYFRDAAQQEVEVLDLLGGYGSLMLGHNRPELVQVLQQVLSERRVTHAQFSMRQEAGDLAQHLSAIARRDSGIDEDFVVHFANSGAEAVELAMKHAEYARVLEMQQLQAELAYHRGLARAAVRRGDARLDVHALEGTVLAPMGPASRFEDLCERLDAHHAALWRRPPWFVALEKAFHGKLMGSVQTTYNPAFSAPFQHLGLCVKFVASGDVAALDQIARDSAGTALDLTIEDGRVQLLPRAVRGISAILVEPIQGEGGIHVMSRDFAQAVRRVCNQQGCPLLIDEVQSGMGRSGRFFAASKLGLKGDSYVLSKSLGGGLVKIAAVLIRKSAYQRDFGLIHSSTFAEDDVSCHVARKVLEICERDEGAVYRMAHDKGERLRAMLEGVRARYPEVIQAIRGEGLLLGVEFAPLDRSRSQLLRSLEHNDSLGYFLAGYLFQSHRIRVAPSGSAPRVLRIEPSVGIDASSIHQLEQALLVVCEMLQKQDLLPFVFPLCQPTRSAPRTEIQDFRGVAHACPAPGLTVPMARPVRKIAFINHLIDARNLASVEPSLAVCTDDELARFIRRMAVDMRSAPYAPVRIESALGSAVDFILYPLAVTSQQMAAYLSGNDLQTIRRAVQDRVIAARDDGCEVAGLGMYTSIVTHNGLSLEVPGIRLTTGNALTVAMAFEAMTQAGNQRQMDWSRATGVVVGATGNIASIYAEMLAEQVPKLVLVGSDKASAKPRLERLRRQIYLACWMRLQEAQLRAERVADLQGIPAAMAKLPWVQQALQLAPQRSPPHAEFLQGCEKTEFIRVSQNLADVALGDVVLCGASQAEPFLGPEHFKSSAVVCDVSVPNNVFAHTAQARPDLWLAQGGVVATPHGASLDPSARAFLKEGQLFACMAETAILGLAGLDIDYSLGDLSARQVREIAGLARLHGFSLAQARKERSL